MFSHPPLEILHLPVRTKSGQALGVVTDVSIDPDTQGVIAYTVRAHRLIPAIVSRTLLIARSQVIGFDENGMIVDDGILSAKTPATAPQPAG